MADTDLAYAAGFIDADGCISLARWSTKAAATRKHQTSHGYGHTPKISAVGTDPAPLELLADLFGGGVWPMRRRAPRERSIRDQRPMFQWAVTGRKAAAAAERLLPYLRIKADQARLVLRFYPEAVWVFAGGGEPMPTEEFTRREALYEAMREANH